MRAWMQIRCMLLLHVLISRQDAMGGVFTEMVEMKIALKTVTDMGLPLTK